MKSYTNEDQTLLYAVADVMFLSEMKMQLWHDQLPQNSYFIA